MSQPTQFSVTWSFPEDGGATVTFDKAAWHILCSVAEQEGRDPVQMISETVAGLFGTTLLKYLVGP
jgi:hypothetical protein